jgi:hypothetical protein
MLTILGAKVSYDTAAWFVLFATSEYLGTNPRLKSNSVVQAVVSAVNSFKLFRREDDRIRRIKDSFKG